MLNASNVKAQIYICPHNLAISSQFFKIKINAIGEFNNCRNAKKKNDFFVLKNNIKYAKAAPQKVADLVEAGAQ